MTTTPWLRAIASITVALTLAGSAPLAIAQPPTLCGTAQPRGCELWEALADGDGPQDPYKVIHSSDGTRLFVFGNDGDFATTAIWALESATGAQAWRATDRYGDYSSTPRDLVVSPDGTRLYAAMGMAHPLTSRPHLALAAFDAMTGEQLWRRTFDLTGAAGLAVSPDGNTLYVGGVRMRASDDIHPFALTTTDGSTLWSAFYDGEGTTVGQAQGPAPDGPRAVALSPDGTRFFLTGESANRTIPVYDAITLAYDTSTGALLWMERLPGLRDDLLGVALSAASYRIEAAPDGTRVFTLGTEGLRAHDAATGTSLWRPSREDHGCEMYGWKACDLAVDGAGGAVFIRTESHFAAYEMSDGALRWTMWAALPNAEYTSANIAVHPDGRTFYVLGNAYKLNLGTGVPDDESTALEAYDAKTGVLLWRVLHRQWEFDFATDLVLSIDGEQAYALTSNSPAGGDDYTLSAYNTRMGLRADPPLPPLI